MSTAASEIFDDNPLFDAAQRGDKNQYLTFILAGEEYGVDILRVQEIKGWENATKIPNAPHYIKGVMNLRGAIVPIIDLRQRFNLDKLEYGPTTVVIVLRVHDEENVRTMGIVVDAVSDVYDIASENLRPAPDFGNDVSVDFVKGLATVEEKMVIILDIDQLLTSGELNLLNTLRTGNNVSTANNDNKKSQGTGLNVTLLENTFSALAPQGNYIVQRFYEELFSRYPDVKPMFANVSIEDQQRKLLSALKLVINNLRDPDNLNNTLRELGKRHREYGAEDAHYSAVTETLLEVMKEVAGDQWTPEVNQAWSDALKAVSKTMQSAHR
jgi:purine-binding chemotaxis protein CheW